MVETLSALLRKADGPLADNVQGELHKPVPLGSKRKKVKKCLDDLTALVKAFNPDEPRDYHGRWTGGSNTLPKEAEWNGLNIYANNGFSSMNASLREDRRDGFYGPHIDAIDQAMFGSTLNRDTTLYRGTSSDLFGKASPSVGQVFSEKGFVSTTSSKAQGAKWAKAHGSDGYLLEITAPKGTHAVDMNVPRPRPKAPGVRLSSSMAPPARELTEKEVLLDRGLSFHIDHVDGKTIKATVLSANVAKAFNPDEPRDKDGKWTTGGIPGMPDDVVIKDQNVQDAMKRGAYDLQAKRLAKAAQTLYINRPVLNANDIIKWAKNKLGLETCIAPDDMHVTIAFSRAPLEWPKALRDVSMTIRPQHPTLALFGPDKDCLVLKFYNEELAGRWAYLRSIGASWDWPGYEPHITLSYKTPFKTIPDVPPYDGEIVFGPEEFAEVKEDWQAGVVEKAGPPDEPRDDHGRWVNSGGGGETLKGLGYRKSASGFGTHLTYLHSSEPIDSKKHQAKLTKTLAKHGFRPVGGVLPRWENRHVAVTLHGRKGQGHSLFVEKNFDVVEKAFNPDEARDAHGRWTDGQVDALAYYNEHGPKLNTALRTGTELTQEQKAAMRGLDSAMRPIDQQKTLYRGLGWGGGVTLKEGQTFMDRGFVSTSRNKDIAFNEFAGKNGWQCYINGADKGADFEKSGLYGPGMESEGEVILPRQTKFSVRQTRLERDGKKTAWLDVVR